MLLAYLQQVIDLAKLSGFAAARIAAFPGPFDTVGPRISDIDAIDVLEFASNG
jgi:hypothetical protein